MRSEIVKELFCFGQSIGCQLCLLGRYGADCSENSAVDRSAVEEELPTDLLDKLFVRCADWWSVDSRRSKLFGCSVLDWRTWVGQVLALQWGWMIELLQCSLHIPRHGQVYLPPRVVPIERDTDVLPTLPVVRDLIVLLEGAH